MKDKNGLEGDIESLIEKRKLLENDLQDEEDKQIIIERDI